MTFHYAFYLRNHKCDRTRRTNFGLIWNYMKDFPLYFSLYGSLYCTNFDDQCQRAHGWTVHEGPVVMAGSRRVNHVAYEIRSTHLPRTRTRHTWRLFASENARKANVMVLRVRTSKCIAEQTVRNMRYGHQIYRVCALFPAITGAQHLIAESRHATRKFIGLLSWLQGIARKSFYM